MSETQDTICEWVAATFPGRPPKQAVIVARANRELAELASEVAFGRFPVKIVSECADVAIILLRLGRVMFPDITLRIPSRFEPEDGEPDADTVSSLMVQFGFLFRDAAINDREANMSADERTYCMGGQQFTYLKGSITALHIICQRHGFTLQHAIDTKMELNRERQWFRNADGHFDRDRGAE